MAKYDDKHNDKPESHDPSKGAQQKSHNEAVLFDEQTVLSRGHAQEVGEKKVGWLSSASERAEDSGNENIQTSVVRHSVWN